MKPIKIINNYVYIVLEHHTNTSDAKVHGAYINKEEAEGKLLKITKKGKGGYLAILKKPVEGKQVYGEHMSNIKRHKWVRIL